jgi:hypothetical protein
MGNSEKLSQRARQLTKDTRKILLMTLPETEFHKHLKSLFSAMDLNAVVEITHGSREFGADLVVITEGPFGKRVSSVVAKIGDIIGKTGKDVDDIRSQISQCITIPRELRTKIDTEKTTEVWLAIAGQLSQQARKRLRSIIYEDYRFTAITQWDIWWLIDKFTKFYPEVFFGGAVMSFIEKQIEKLESIGQLSKKGENLNLSEWYVDPFVSKAGIPLELDENSLRLALKETEFSFEQLHSVMKSANRIFLSGDPGVGKSTALAKLALDLYRDASNKANKSKEQDLIEIPLIVQARDILKYNDCNTLINEHISEEEILKKIRISLLIIDGLDEVSQDLQEQVLLKGNLFCQNMSCHLIIGTRKIDIIKNSPLGIKNYELLPFKVNQAIRLFEKLVKDEGLLSTLKEGIEKIKTQLPMTPLSLILLIEIVEAQHEIPATLCELYDRYFDLVMGKWELRDKGIESLFTFEIKMRFLAELAQVQYYEQGNSAIPKATFDEFLAYFAKKRGIELGEIKKFANEIDRTAVLQIKDIVRFRHRSFLDYFVALNIFNKQTEITNIEDCIANLYFDSSWNDVAFFYIGLRRDLPKSVLDTIKRFAGNDLRTLLNKYSIGKLLQAGYLTEYDIKLDGISYAATYMLPVREELTRIAKASSTPFPKFFIDFLLMMAAEWSMSSITMQKALKDVCDDLLEIKSRDSIWQAGALIWALWRFLTSEEREDLLNRLLSKLTMPEEISPEERSEILMLMVCMKGKSRDLTKSINRKLTRLLKSNPEIIKRLLPPLEKGFRRKTLKTD